MILLVRRGMKDKKWKSKRIPTAAATTKN